MTRKVVPTVLAVTLLIGCGNRPPGNETQRERATSVPTMNGETSPRPPLPSDLALPSGRPQSSGTAAVVTLSGRSRGPSGTLVFGSSSQVGIPGSYCWTSPPGSAGGAPACVDVPPDVAIPRGFVEVPNGSTLLLRGDAPTVEGRLVIVRGDPGQLRLEIVRTLDLSHGSASLGADPGEYTLEIRAGWPQGSGFLYFGVRIVER